MGQKFVIDTSILIDHFRGGDRWESFLKSVDQSCELLFSVVTVFELFSGQSSKQPKSFLIISSLLNKLSITPINFSIAQKAGEIYRDVAKDLQVPDYIIAATAFETNSAVVTLNHKHLSRIPGLSIYRF